MQGRIGLLAIVVLIAGCAAPAPKSNDLPKIQVSTYGYAATWSVATMACLAAIAIFQFYQMRNSLRSANLKRTDAKRRATIDFIIANRDRARQLMEKIVIPPAYAHTCYSASDRREFDRWWTKSAGRLNELVAYWNQLSNGVATGAFDMETIHITIGDQLRRHSSNLASLLLRRRLQIRNGVEPFEIMFQRLHAMNKAMHEVTRFAIWRICRQHARVDSTVKSALKQLSHETEPICYREFLGRLYQAEPASHDFATTILTETRIKQGEPVEIKVGRVEWSHEHATAEQLTTDERRLQHLFANVEHSSRRTATTLSGADFGQPRYVVREDRRIVAHLTTQALEEQTGELAAIWRRAIEQLKFDDSNSSVTMSQPPGVGLMAGDISLLRDLAVFPWVQRKGLGLTMLRHGVSAIRNQGRVPAMMIADDQPWAQQLCEHFGARFAGWLPSPHAKAEDLQEERGKNGVSLYLL